MLGTDRRSRNVSTCLDIAVFTSTCFDISIYTYIYICIYVVSSCLICAVRRVQSVKVFQCFCLPLVRTRAVHVLRFPPSISKCLWIGTFLDFLRACVGLNAFTFYKLQRDFERGSGNAPPLESWVLFFNCEEVQCFTKLVPLTALAQD